MASNLIFPGWPRLALWLVLSMPAIFMIRANLNGSVLLMDLLHSSGEMAIRLMILALLPGPLADYFGRNRFLREWLSVRRNLGVASFAYGVLHLAFYVVDMQYLSAIIDEFEIPSIWTGWIALLLMIPPAAISFDIAMRRLGRRWKQLQMLVYAVLALALVHWLLLGWRWQPALVHLSPLIVAWLLRVLGLIRNRQAERFTT